MNNAIFVVCPEDLRPRAFAEHYQAAIDTAITENATFVVTDHDWIVQWYLRSRAPHDHVIVFHTGDKPVRNVGDYPAHGNFDNDTDRDIAMTLLTATDLAPITDDTRTQACLARRRATTHEATS